MPTQPASDLPETASPVLKPVRSRKLQSLASQIYEHLRRDIVHGRLAPQTKLVELEVAAQMGTSQGPVREAFQHLERDGLVERRARTATYVTSLSPGEIYEYFMIRSVVEGYAIRRAVQHISPDQIQELETLVGQMRDAGRRDDLYALVDQDMVFHRRICEWSGSAVLLNTWLPLSAHIHRFVAQTHRRYFPDLVELANTHVPILEALRLGDADVARRAIQEHVMLIWSYIDPQSKL